MINIVRYQFHRDAVVPYVYREPSKLIVVSWSYRPFCISFSHMGTKEEISNIVEIRDNCTYKCHSETFKK